MKKRIAPVVITLLILGFAAAYMIGLIWAINGIFGIPRFISYIYMAVITAGGIALVVTLIRRLKEIKEEENDDLSQY